SGNPTVHEENGATIPFSVSGTTYTAPSRVLAALTKNADGSLTLLRRDQTSLTFNALGQLTKETDRNGYATTFVYSGGLLSSVTDAAGRSLTFSYTGSLLTGVTDVAGGRTLAFRYDANSNLTDFQDVNGVWSHATYDANHLML